MTDGVGLWTPSDYSVVKKSSILSISTGYKSTLLLGNIHYLHDIVYSLYLSRWCEVSHNYLDWPNYQNRHNSKSMSDQVDILQK